MKTVGDYVADLGDRDEEVRNLAREVLVALGPGAVPALAGLLDDEHWQVREAAVEVLGQIGPAAAGALPALSGLLSETDGAACCRVVEALNRIKQPGC